MIPRWDECGLRWFCCASFEITQTHLVRWRLWPGQSIRLGEVIPAKRGGSMSAITEDSLAFGTVMVIERTLFLPLHFA